MIGMDAPLWSQAHGLVSQGKVGKSITTKLCCFRLAGWRKAGGLDPQNQCGKAARHRGIRRRCLSRDGILGVRGQTGSDTSQMTMLIIARLTSTIALAERILGPSDRMFFGRKSNASLRCTADNRGATCT